MEVLGIPSRHTQPGQAAPEVQPPPGFSAAERHHHSCNARRSRAFGTGSLSDCLRVEPFAVRKFQQRDRSGNRPSARLPSQHLTATFRAISDQLVPIRVWLRGKTVYEYGYPASGDVCPAATGRDELGTGSAYPQNCRMSGTANTITYRSGLDWRWFSYNLDTSGGQSGTPGYVFSDRQYRTVGPLEGLNSKRVSARRIDGLVVVRSRKPVYSAATVVRAMAALCRVPRKCVLIGRRL